jgi:hypothetical protein
VTPHWFVTCHTTATQNVGGSLVEWPSSLAHAKRMGSTATACGVPASSWRRLFNVAFPPARTECCRECLVAVGAINAP